MNKKKKILVSDLCIGIPPAPVETCQMVQKKKKTFFHNGLSFFFFDLLMNKL